MIKYLKLITRLNFTHKNTAKKNIWLQSHLNEANDSTIQVSVLSKTLFTFQFAFKNIVIEDI